MRRKIYTIKDVYEMVVDATEPAFLPIPEESMTDLEKLWTDGYGPGDGGYAFEELDQDDVYLKGVKAAGFKGEIVLAWDDPDGDYFPFGEPKLHHRDCVLLLVSPDAMPMWPEVFKETDEDYSYHLISMGQVVESDRDCHCYGKLVEWTGAAGEPVGHETGDWVQAEVLEQKILVEAEDTLPKLMWDFTGNYSDRPYPACTRCKGDGSVLSPGGSFAWYELKEAD